MKILVHDYAGHPFTSELARELSNRNHSVDYVWFAKDIGPKGNLAKGPDDDNNLSFYPMGQSIDYSKSNFLKRRRGDIAFGKEIAAHIAATKPDVLISGNTPTEAQEHILRACRKLKIPFIYWCQDFYSIAASKLLSKKIPIIGHAIGAYYKFLEKRQMQYSQRVIHITDAFYSQTDAWGIERDKVDVIPNWGVIDEINVLSKNNDWAKEKNLVKKHIFLYSGTLALKHNPALLSELAQSVDDESEVILVSAGVGADFLKSKVKSGLKNIRILPLQPFKVFEKVLASGDVLLAVIERDAGQFSVPSKLLSYLCAGRPIVLAAPRDNLAAQILSETGAGTVVEPEDINGFVKAAMNFKSNPSLSGKSGKSGRAYAEEHFNICTVADRFETCFSDALAKFRK